MKSIKHTLAMVKRVTELEAAMRQPAGILLSEYQELQSLREQLADRSNKQGSPADPAGASNVMEADLTAGRRPRRAIKR